MKIKFIVGRLATNDYWDYYSKNPKNIIFPNLQDNYFIGNHPAAATHFDTYAEAEHVIKYIGIGIFKIDKIFINDQL